MHYIAEQIKRYLDQFGHKADGKPIFRIVFSTNQFEKRYGTYNEFHGSLFVRTITGVKEVPKYPYNKDCYVIERWAPPELCNWKELPESKQNGSYEPLYFYQDDNKNPLEPNLLVAQLLMKSFMRPRESGEIKRYYIDKDKELDKDMDKAVNDLFEEESVLADKIKFGEAASFSGIKSKEE